MKKYIPNLPEEMSKDKQKVMLIVGIVFLILGIPLKSFYTFPIGLLLILAFFFHKETYVDDNGLNILYGIFTWIRHKLWTFEEITNINKEEKHGLMALHFVGESLSKLFIYDEPTANEIISLAKSKNETIDVSDLD